MVTILSPRLRGDWLCFLSPGSAFFLGDPVFFRGAAFLGDADFFESAAFFFGAAFFLGGAEFFAAIWPLYIFGITLIKKSEAQL
jgi:hypothetical protein